MFKKVLNILLLFVAGFAGEQSGGKHNLKWDYTGVAKGVYFLIVDINGRPAMMKISVW